MCAKLNRLQLQNSRFFVYTGLFKVFFDWLHPNGLGAPHKSVSGWRFRQSNAFCPKSDGMRIGIGTNTISLKRGHE